MKNLFKSVSSAFRLKCLDILAFLALALALLGLLWQHSTTQLDDDWENFVSKHHCTTANKFKDDKSLKSGWVCDDGKTYYRWRQQL